MKKENEVLLVTDWPIGPKTNGKVRDIYDLDDMLLIVTTDRISAFDVVMPNGVPFKGPVLNKLSVLWLKKLADIIPNHFLIDNVEKYPPICLPYINLLKGRSMLVKKARTLPVECVVRGYITGSGWKSYQKNGTVCGIRLPDGLLESQKMEELIFTPTTKAEQGHDLPITFEQMTALVGLELAHQMRSASLRLYLKGEGLAKKAGIIIADTKFEFGLDPDGNLLLIDEVLTPDSSRFWPLTDYAPGRPQTSFDKQFLRDYLLSTSWNQQYPAPELPAEIIEKTSDKYLEAYSRLKSVLL